MAGGDAEKGKKIAIIGLSTILLVAMIAAMVIGINGPYDDDDDDIENNRKNHVSSSLKVIQTFCHPTDYKKECEETLATEAGNTTDPKELIKIALNVTVKRIGEKIKETEFLHEVERDPRAKMALDTCKQLMDLSIGEFTRSLDGMGKFDLQNLDKIFMNLKVWLSGAVTYQDTCLDGFENTTSEAGKKITKLLTTSMHMSSNALAIITNMADKIVKDWNVTNLLGGRRLLHESITPSWVNHHDVNKGTILFKHKANVTVAIDGSGDFKSINKALEKVPQNNEKPFVIYIKEGVYPEYVEVTKDMTYVVFVGDGGKKTRITGNKNFIDGITTYRTATVGMSLFVHIVKLN